MEQVWAGLDQLIAELLDEAGADGVDLLGHSLGTTVSQGYLNSSPERAARVAHYVNIDGRTTASPPAGWKRWRCGARATRPAKSSARKNYYAPDQSHVQVATSADVRPGLRVLHRTAPKTTDVVHERGRIRLSGEANVFPQNLGADGFTLRILEMGRRTGERSTGVLRPPSRSGRTALGTVQGAGRRALRVRADPHRWVGPPPLLPAVPAERPPGPPAHVPARRGPRPVEGAQRHVCRLRGHPLQGDVGRPGRQQRHPRNQRGEHPQPGHRATTSTSTRCSWPTTTSTV